MVRTIQSLGAAGTVALLCAAASFASGASAEPRTIDVGWLIIMDWESDYPEAPNCLKASPLKPADWTINVAPITLPALVSGEENILDYDVVVTTGHLSYTFSAAEKAILESFLDAGGTIWFDDCGRVEVDNFPYGMEIDFGNPEYSPIWGTCYGSSFTVSAPGHPLVNALYRIDAPMIRTDAGLVEAQWFTPAYAVDPGYTVVITGHEVHGYYDGPFLVAARVSNGKIAASFGDTTCALECVSYRNPGRPVYDYSWVLNLLGWKDSDGDSIDDWVEDAFMGAPATVPVDTDGDTISDYLDVDTDADGVLDVVEAGDDDPDTPPVDTDGDTVPDYRDADADGDTIPDGTEERADADGDRLADSDADGDTVPNRLDEDSDGDGKDDSVEGTGDGDGDGIMNFVDADDATPPEGAETGEPGARPEDDGERVDAAGEDAPVAPDARDGTGGDFVIDGGGNDGTDAAGDEGEGPSSVLGRAGGCGCAVAR